MFEYKVVPAPTKGQKSKGIKGPEARFAFALEALMNELAGEGWEYVRADTLPSVERAGLTGSTTEWRNMLVFRRSVEASDSAEVRIEPKLPKAIPGPEVADIEPSDPPLTAPKEAEAPEQVPVAPLASRRFSLISTSEKSES